MNYLMFFDQIAYVILTHLASNELDKCMKSRLIQILNDVFIDFFFKNSPMWSRSWYGEWQHQKRAVISKLVLF